MLPKDNEIQFDEMLKKSLKNHLETFPDDFADNLSAKIEKAEIESALKKIIMQKRLSWAALIILPLTIIGALMLFPSLLVYSNNAISEVNYYISQIPPLLLDKWQMIACCFLALFASVYAFYQMFITEN